MARTYITTISDSYETDAPREYFDLDKVERWDGAKSWDGQNNADINVGANAGQAILRTAGGRWVLHSWSNWVGTPDSYNWATDEQAQEWLLFNGHDNAATAHFGPAAEERAVGRPEIGGRVCVRLGELVDPLDAWAAENGMSRADAVRYAVSQMLARVNA
jgi:hypothetical protein